MVGRINC